MTLFYRRRAFVIAVIAILLQCLLLAAPVSAGTYPIPFLPPVIYPTSSISTTRVVITDYNGDGLNDVLVTGDSPVGAPGVLYIFLQDKSGHLSAPITKPLPYTPSWISAGDLNGDGRVDVAIGSYHRIDVLYRDSSGNLSTSTMLSTTASSATAIADINGDGRLDLLGFSVNTTGGTDIAIYYQNSDGTLSMPAQYHTSFISWMPAIGDVTGDRLPDILLSSASTAWPDDFVILPQNPDHSFGPDVHSGGSGLGAGSIAIGDINADGRNDVASSVWVTESNNIDVFLQDTDGQLHSSATYGVIQNPASIQLADLNGDGHLDIALASDGYGVIGVYLQDANGKFTNQILYTMPVINGTPAVPYGPQGIAVGDISGDGKPDIVVADFDEGLAVLYNSLGTVPTNDLSVNLISLPDPAVVDSPATLSLRVSNAGPSAATGVVLSDALPPSFTYESSDHNCSSSFGVLTCSVGAIPAGSSTTVNITANPNTAVAISSYGLYPFTNSALVVGNEIDYAQDNNTLDTRLTATNPSPGAIQFSATNYSVSEGSGTVSARIDVTRSNGHGIEQVWWVTTGLTAVPGVDYQAASGALTWGDGDNSTKSFSVEILRNNNASGPSKTIGLSLEQPLVGALGSKRTATLTINDAGVSNSSTGGQSNSGGSISSGGSSGGGGVTDGLTMMLLLCAAARRWNRRRWPSICQ